MFLPYYFFVFVKSVFWDKINSSTLKVGTVLEEIPKIPCFTLQFVKDTHTVFTRLSFVIIRISRT